MIENARILGRRTKSNSLECGVDVAGQQQRCSYIYTNAYNRTHQYPDTDVNRHPYKYANPNPDSDADTNFDIDN